MFQVRFLGTVSTRQPSGSDGEEVIHSIPNIENELLRILLSQLRALIHFWKKIKKKKVPLRTLPHGCFKI